MNSYKMVVLGTLISQAKNVRCGNGDFPVLSMTMHDGLIFQDDKFKKVIASKDRSDYKVVYRNQLVISFPIDEGVLAAQRIVDAGIVSPAYGIWDIDQEKILPEFLEYALRCKRALSYYKAKLRGSTARRRSLPTPTLLAFTVPLPSIQEQQHILDIIHKAKSIICNRNFELDAFDELIKARFVEMIQENKPSYVKLKDVVEEDRIITYGIVKPGEYTEGGIPIIKVKDFPNGVILMHDMLLASPEIESKYERSRVREGDLLFSIRGSVGRTAFVPKELTDANITQDTARLSISDNFSPKYVRAALEYDPVQYDISQYVRGVAVRGINLSDLREIEIPVVDLALQEQFAAFVEQTDKSKFSCECGGKEAYYAVKYIWESLCRGTPT